MQEKKFDNLKFILVGDDKIGKTALKLCFEKGTYEEWELKRNREFVIKTVKIDGGSVKIELWDLPFYLSAEAEAGAINNYVKGAHVALLVYDITNQQSFYNIEGYLKELQELQEFTREKCEFILVATKKDRSLNRKVDSLQAQAFAEGHKLSYVETSALKNENVEETFLRLADEIIKQQILAEIESKASKKSLSNQEIISIYRKQYPIWVKEIKENPSFLFRQALQKTTNALIENTKENIRTASFFSSTSALKEALSDFEAFRVSLSPSEAKEAKKPVVPLSQARSGSLAPSAPAIIGYEQLSQFEERCKRFFSEIKREPNAQQIKQVQVDIEDIFVALCGAVQQTGKTVFQYLYLFEEERSDAMAIVKAFEKQLASLAQCNALPKLVIRDYVDANMAHWEQKIKKILSPEFQECSKIESTCEEIVQLYTLLSVLKENAGVHAMHQYIQALEGLKGSLRPLLESYMDKMVAEDKKGDVSEVKEKKRGPTVSSSETFPATPFSLISQSNQPNNSAKPTASQHPPGGPPIDRGHPSDPKGPSVVPVSQFFNSVSASSAGQKREVKVEQSPLEPFMGKLREELLCPVTLEIMTDPLTLIPSGHTIDGSSYGRLVKPKKCPLTQAPITGVVPNVALRKVIEAYNEQLKADPALKERLDI